MGNKFTTSLEVEDAAADGLYRDAPVKGSPEGGAGTLVDPVLR